MAEQKSKQNVFTSSMDVDAMTTALPGAIDLKQRIIQDFLLIWLDANIDESTVDCQNTFTQLQSVVNNVNIFTERNEAIDFLTELDAVRVFLVIEDTIGQHILSLIHDIPQLDAIYILFGNKSQHEQWTQKGIKIKGIHTDIQPLCEALQLAVKQCNQDSMAMSFVTVSEGATKLNVNQLEPSFMYTQIFKETILEMEYNEQSIKNLAIYCRKFYENNVRELNIIHDFEHNYRLKSPIWWYTRQCFTYQMLNRALRTLEGDTIINMGFFICDLHKQIQELYRSQVGTYGDKSFTVYRGQGLFITDFEKLQKTIGGLMSFNNFLSTSIKRDVSLRFATSASTKTNMIGVLFRMTIDPSISSAPFASIQEVSYYRREEEILFSMHTIFRVGAISKIDDSKPLYQVDLQLTADDDQELRTLTAFIREEVVNKTGWIRLGSLLLKIGQPEKAEELYNVLLEQTSDKYEQAFYHNQLGYIKDHQGDYKKAIEYHEKALEICQETLPPNHPCLATSYNNIGLTYDNMGEYSKALSFYEKALEIRQKILPPDHPNLANSYNAIGSTYTNMGEYSKALSFYEKDLEICQKTLPPNHPDLATSCNNIGLACANMGEYSKALSFYEKALEISQKSLPPNHPDLAASYNNIGTSYNKMEEYSKALSFYEKALEIRQKTLPSNHPDLADSYNNVGSAYNGMGEHSRALSFYEKALEIRQKTLPPNHPSLAVAYDNIGSAYKSMGEYSKALSFHEKALEIRQKTLPNHHPDVAASYTNIGFAYEDMGEYSKVLSFHEKALEIRQKTLPPNHPDLVTSYNGISSAHTNMGEYSKALLFYQKVLEIRQKTLPTNDRDLAASYNNIGSVYEKMEEYSKALSFFEKSLEISRKILPSNHPHFGTLYNNIGLIYKNMKVYSKALSFYEKSLEINQKILPPNHPDLAASYNNIGSAYNGMGEYTKALSFYRKALEIRQNTLSSNHPDLATSYNNIGLTYFIMGEHSKALSYFERSETIFRDTLPVNHPYIKTVRDNIDYIKENIL